MNIDRNSSNLETFEKKKSFQKIGLCEQIAEAAVFIGWKEPYSVQKESIPYSLQGKDIIGVAKTGSGKTGAFTLPISQEILCNPQPLYALVLSPSRELAIQILEQFGKLVSGIGIKSCPLIGGIKNLKQVVSLAKKPNILVGTPGRVVDHLTNTNGFSLRKLKHLVLDEADRLLHLNFEIEINQILKVISQERKTAIFSSTMTNKITKLQKASLKDPIKVEISRSYMTAETLMQFYIFVPVKYKDCYLVQVLMELATCTIIIFTDTCESTLKISLTLLNLGLECVAIHGQLPQSHRLATLCNFKSGKKSILVATDLASRGLDIPAVDLVINYRLPSNPKDYVHRVGRTARAGRLGRAISLITQYDVTFFQKTETFIGKKMERFPSDNKNALALVKRVKEAQRSAALAINKTKKMQVFPSQIS